MPVSRASVAGRAIRALVTAEVRAVQWAPMAGGAIAASLVVWLPTRAHTVDRVVVLSSLGQRVLALRAGAIVLALGAAFVLDDPAAGTTAHLPVTVLRRRLARLAVALLGWATAWAGLIGIAMRTPLGGQSFPLGPVTLEAAAMVAMVLAAAAVAAPFVPEGLGGIAAGPVLIVTMGIAYAMAVPPWHLAMFVGDPMTPGWGAAHVRWGFLLGASVLMLLWCSRDPWRRAVPRPRARPVPSGRRESDLETARP